MRDAQYITYIDALLEKAMVKKFSSDDLDIDPDSYVEIEAIANEML